MCPGWQDRREWQSCFSRGHFLLRGLCPMWTPLLWAPSVWLLGAWLSEALWKIEDISEQGGKALGCEPKTLISAYSPFPSASLSTAVLFPCQASCCPPACRHPVSPALVPVLPQSRSPPHQCPHSLPIRHHGGKHRQGKRIGSQVYVGELPATPAATTHGGEDLGRLFCPFWRSLVFWRRTLWAAVKLMKIPRSWCLLMGCPYYLAFQG